jgi:hypothetical protein
MRTLPAMLNIIYVYFTYIDATIEFLQWDTFQFALGFRLEVVDLVKFGDNTLCVYVCRKFLSSREVREINAIDRHQQVSHGHLHAEVWQHSLEVQFFTPLVLRESAAGP